MKVLAINSSPLGRKGNTEIILEGFLGGLQEAGAEVEKVYTKELDIGPCLGKLACWIKTPGKCCQQDDMALLLEKLAEADIWVFATPLYWDGVTGPLKNLFDRMLPLLEPNIELFAGHCRHPLRKNVKQGKIVLISTCGFWESDNFEPLVVHIKAICKNIHREFAGALLRPHGAHLKYMIKHDNQANEILKASHAAGVELAKTGQISQHTLVNVSKELLPREEYIKRVNGNFKRLLTN